jgi:hypothetical protein
MLVNKNLFKDILHLFVYILVISLIVFTCLCLSHSYDGYRINSILDNYYYYDNSFIIVNNDVELEVIKDNKSETYYYFINKGILTFNSQEFVIFDNGIFDEENNIFYFKI